MSTAVIVGIVIAALVVGALLLVTTARRSDLRRGAGALSRETIGRDSAERVEVLSGRAYEQSAVAVATGEPPVASTELVRAPLNLPTVWVPPDREAVGVSRRQFFNRASIALTGVAISGAGAGAIAFLWPKLGGGFGGKINAGKKEEVMASIAAGRGFFYLAEGRAWVTQYPANALPKIEGVYTGPVAAGMKEGFVALYQKCPHLGCRVPECTSSQWFECPCHGSQYSRVGEKKGGPAPRGMDLFGVSVVNGSVIVDTGSITPGAPIGTNTTGQEAEGPNCVGAGGGSH